MYTNVKRKRRKITFFPSERTVLCADKERDSQGRPPRRTPWTAARFPMKEREETHFPPNPRRHFREVINTRELEYQQRRERICIIYRLYWRQRGLIKSPTTQTKTQLTPPGRRFCVCKLVFQLPPEEWQQEEVGGGSSI